MFSRRQPKIYQVTEDMWSHGTVCDGTGFHGALIKQSSRNSGEADNPVFPVLFSSPGLLQCGSPHF